MLLAGIALLIFWRGIDALIAITLITIGNVSIITVWYKHKKYGDMPDMDERTQKVAALAVSLSWVVTMWTIAILMWLDHFSIVKMTVMQVLGIICFIMIFFAVATQWYVGRKGDMN